MSVQKFKKGFTLIELMVVIVIIGILAAIAIPKLFGMTAKAKAQEVGPAAGTWIKLHQAYQMEKGTVGTWEAIGYIPPGTYDKTAGTSVSTNFSYSLGITTGGKWKAANTGKALGNGCLANNWVAELTFNGTTDGENPAIAWTGATKACTDLTPNFNDLGTGGTLPSS